MIGEEENKEGSLMFDFPHFYDRIASELHNDCVVVEVGVANGDSALYLAQKIHELGKRFKLYMVDNLDYGQYIQLCAIYQNIIRSGLGEFIEVVPYDSIKASEFFNDNSLDFCFIDSSHLYQETKDSIICWYEKLKDEGILAGHDVITAPGVTKAVRELIPEIITREPIDKEDQYQEFEPERLLNIENTTNGYGVFFLKKRFYWKPTITINK